MYKANIFSLSILFISFLFSFSSAQELSIPSQIPELEEQISVSVDPELPGPNENVVIRVDAYGTDLTRANITWRHNGVVKKSGRGQQVFELNSGNAGTLNNISIIIQPYNGPAIEKKLSFKSQQVDLLWEARSYTPPFYKGKSLPGYQGSVVAVAMPNFSGAATAMRNVTYKWFRNGDVANNESGFEKSSFLFQGGILLEPDDIQVEASDDTQSKARELVTVEYEQPFALFYENNPIYGMMFNREAGSTALRTQEISLVAIPYFFETALRRSNVLSYVWRINGIESPLFTKDTGLFRYEGDEGGTAILDLTINNNQNFLQEARTETRVQLSPRSERVGF